MSSKSERRELQAEIFKRAIELGPLNTNFVGHDYVPYIADNPDPTPLDYIKFERWNERTGFIGRVCLVAENYSLGLRKIGSEFVDPFSKVEVSVEQAIGKTVFGRYKELSDQYTRLELKLHAPITDNSSENNDKKVSRTEPSGQKIVLRKFEFIPSNGSAHSFDFTGNTQETGDPDHIYSLRKVIEILDELRVASEIPVLSPEVKN